MSKSNSDLLAIIDAQQVIYDVKNNGPSRLNLKAIRKAYDALSEGITSGAMTEVTLSIYRDMEKNGVENMSEQLPLLLCRSRSRPTPDIVARTRTRELVRTVRPLRGWPNKPEWLFVVYCPDGKRIAHTVFASDKAEALEVLNGYMPDKAILRLELCPFTWGAAAEG